MPSLIDSECINWDYQTEWPIFKHYSPADREIVSFCCRQDVFVDIIYSLCSTVDRKFP